MDFRGLFGGVVFILIGLIGGLSLYAEADTLLDSGGAGGARARGVGGLMKLLAAAIGPELTVVLFAFCCVAVGVISIIGSLPKEPVWE